MAKRIIMRTTWLSLVLCAAVARRAVAASDESGLLLVPEACTGSRTTTRLRSRRSLSEKDDERLAVQLKAMAWTAEESVVEGTTTFSVIVVESKHHTSNLFRDERRVRAFSRKFDGTDSAVVASVQFASPRPQHMYKAEESDPPFNVAHNPDVDQKVTIVHILDFAGDGHALGQRQASHLQAVCDDESVTTILVVSDETCRREYYSPGIPTSCFQNVIRIFPYNTVVSPDGGPPYPYIPLGPRDTYDYVSPETVRATSTRQLLFNLQVRPDTSDRRVELIETAQIYQEDNPDVACAPNRKTLHANEWQALLLASKFTLSPSGRNPETFRTWEALEAGSIPILSKLDFTHPATSPMSHHDCGIGEVGWNTMADSPFAKEVSVETWDELPALLDRLRQAPPEYLDKLQQDSIAWYTTVMQKTYWSVLDFGRGHDIFPQNGPVVYGDL